MALSCTPASLEKSAACFICIPKAMQAAVEIYLLTQIAGSTLTPAQLVAAAKCFRCIPKSEVDNVKIYLLCKAAGGT